MDVQCLGESQVVLPDALENGLVKFQQIHLVDGHDDMADAQQAGDEAVPAGLGLHAVTSVDQDDGQIGSRGTGGHVARVLFVPRAVGNDELACVGAEIAVRHVNGDALFPLGLKAVDQQGQINCFVSGVVLLAVALDGCQLVFKDQPGVMQQASDQRGFAIVDTAAGDEAQQILGFVPGQIGVDVFGNQVGLVCHQKYPSIFFFSIEPDWSWSMARPWRSLVRVSSISRMMSGKVVALDSTAPVSG